MCLTVSKIWCACEGINSWACVWHSPVELHFSAPTSCCCRGLVYKVTLVIRIKEVVKPPFFAGSGLHFSGWWQAGLPTALRQEARTLPTFWMCLAVDHFCFKPCVWFSLLAQFSGMQTTEIIKCWNYFVPTCTQTVFEWFWTGLCKSRGTLKAEVTEKLLLTLPSTKGMVWKSGRESSNRLERVRHELKLLKQSSEAELIPLQEKKGKNKQQNPWAISTINLFLQ